MLVLRRKIGEILLLSGGVEIEVMGITRSRVKLGIRAPKSIVVQRKEGLPIADENQQASLLMRMRQTGDVLTTTLVQSIVKCSTPQENSKTVLHSADM